MPVDIISYALHTLFAALWAGATVFITIAVLPAADRDGLGPGGLGTILNRFAWLTRLSVLALLATGGHLAGTLYTADTLTSTSTGYLVLAMLGLWFLLAVTIEVGGVRVRRVLDGGSARAGAAAVRPFYYLASVFALLLLFTAGLLGANRLFVVF